MSLDFLSSPQIDDITLDSIDITNDTVNSLVLDFFIEEGYTELIDTFIQESNTQIPNDYVLNCDDNKTSDNNNNKTALDYIRENTSYEKQISLYILYTLSLGPNNLT